MKAYSHLNKHLFNKKRSPVYAKKLKYRLLIRENIRLRLGNKDYISFNNMLGIEDCKYERGFLPHYCKVKLEELKLFDKEWQLRDIEPKNHKYERSYSNFYYKVRAADFF